MSDVIENDVDQQPIDNTEQDTTEATETKPEKAPKVDKTKPCLCSLFEVGKFDPDVKDEDAEIFSTGCEQTTQRTFAQGHDARLVSFLVDGYFDQYELRIVDNGVARTFATPADAALVASESLHQKALKATENRAAKVAATGAKKAEKEAAKAQKAAAAAEAKAKKEAEKEAAKAKKAEEKATKPQAEVVAGSQEGDLPELPEGVVKIKVGRWEYDATIDVESGEASFVDGKGEAQVIERDGYRILQDA